MSLDYIFIKAMNPVDTLDELEEDESYTPQDYQRLVERLFPEISWGSSGSARLSLQDTSVEIETSAVSLTIRMRGQNTDPAIILKLATQCLADNVVVVDAQTSELVSAEGAAQSAEQYKAWYLSVLREAQ